MNISPRPPLRLTPLVESVPAHRLTSLQRSVARAPSPGGGDTAGDRRFFCDVLRAYDSWVTRGYLLVRFSIIRRILSDLLANLPPSATVLNLGSGIGLFDIYGARHQPESRFIGMDIDARRIAVSRMAAERLGLRNVVFVHGDVTEALPDLRPDVVIALDVLHHMPPAARRNILAWTAEHLSPRGVLFIKDISTQVRWKLGFTRVLDDLMTGFEPVHYFPVEEMQGDLAALGFSVASFHLWDYIPFPHVMHVARRPADG